MSSSIPGLRPQRRQILCLAGAAAVGLPFPPRPRPLRIIQAPCNLGLRPPGPGHEPGAWRAPAALEASGLHDALGAERVIRLARPIYSFDEQPGSRIRNGPELRRYSEELAGAVAEALGGGATPVVVGGDCSILLGCLLGARAAGPVGLIHIDGHSDFYHPGNYDAASRLGTAAGMDLALATGRGEPLLASWGGSALVEDVHVVQIGERDEPGPNYDYSDILSSAVRRLPVRQVLAEGVERAVAAALAPVAGGLRPLWIHLDLDVLDQTVMPAVDSPGSPGLTYADLSALLRGLTASGRVLGVDVTIYDPDLDPTGRFAREIVQCLGDGLSPLARSAA